MPHKDPEARKQYRKEYLAKRKAEIKIQRAQHYAANAERLRANCKEWRDANVEHIAQKNLEYRTQNAEAVKAKQKEWYDNGGMVRKSATSAARLERIKLEFVAAYGGACPCGETGLDRLCADHVNDDGSAHRAAEGILGSIQTYLWAKRNGWPKTLQLLCHNCNAVKAAAVHRKQRKDQTQESSGNRTNRLLREEVLHRYSGGAMCCQLCAATDVETLQIDHIDGGGRRHLKETRSRAENVSLYRDLRARGYPDGFRVLCASCNMEHGIRQRRADSLARKGPSQDADSEPEG